MTECPPMLVIAGVSGSGKSTLGRRYARRIGGLFLDADDFHPPANVAKMKRGQPLDDYDRSTWLQQLSSLLQARNLSRDPTVLACSALKREYQEKLREAAPQRIQFVYLDGPPEVIRARVERRSREEGHFMPASLLDSQLSLYEIPEGAKRLNVSRPIKELVEQLCAELYPKRVSPQQKTMSDFITISRDDHDQLVAAFFLNRGYFPDEVAAMTYLTAEATRHGLHGQGFLKAMRLDDLYGSKVGGCKPGAEIQVVDSRFTALEVWDARGKHGIPVGFQAIDRAIQIADKTGVAQIIVDGTFPYLWGGGFVAAAAERGYLAYATCTSVIAEVTPPLGKKPTIGANMHSWAFPTSPILGYPIVVDWESALLDMERVNQLKHQGKNLPPDAAVDAEGKQTTNPYNAQALLPVAGHRGFGLALVTELLAAFSGAGLPSVRGRLASDAEEKNTSSLAVQIIHPEALASNSYAGQRTQMDNIVSVLESIMQGNEESVYPGQLEAEFRKRSDQAGGLLVTQEDLDGLNQVAGQLGHEELKPLQRADQMLPPSLP